jgi:hypothetical protein
MQLLPLLLEGVLVLVGQVLPLTLRTPGMPLLQLLARVPLVLVLAAERRQKQCTAFTLAALQALPCPTLQFTMLQSTLKPTQITLLPRAVMLMVVVLAERRQKQCTAFTLAALQAPLRPPLHPVKCTVPVLKRTVPVLKCTVHVLICLKQLCRMMLGFTHVVLLDRNYSTESSNVSSPFALIMHRAGLR